MIVTTKELVQTIPGMTRDKLKYILRLADVEPVRRDAGKGRPFSFRSEDAQLIRAIWDLRQRGFTWEAAVREARSNHLQPTLFGAERQ